MKARTTACVRANSMLLLQRRRAVGGIAARRRRCRCDSGPTCAGHGSLTQETLRALVHAGEARVAVHAHDINGCARQGRDGRHGKRE